MKLYRGFICCVGVWLTCCSDTESEHCLNIALSLILTTTPVLIAGWLQYEPVGDITPRLWSGSQKPVGKLVVEVDVLLSFMDIYFCLGKEGWSRVAAVSLLHFQSDFLFNIQTSSCESSAASQSLVLFMYKSDNIWQPA